MINWTLTAKFSSLNTRNETTCGTYSKDIGWKIKASTNTLPTLDILKRNFPDLIKDSKCMLCNIENETNEHLWKCPSLMPTIRSTFRELANIAQDILNKDANKINYCITSAIKYSNTFRWSLDDDTEITDNAILLLRCYVPQDLYKSFRSCFNSQKLTIRCLMKFMDISFRLTKQKIWKSRSQEWKKRKDLLGINKKSFKLYRRDRSRRNTRPRVRPDFGYVCPHTISLRNYFNRADLLFIILASSNFLHSGLKLLLKNLIKL
ncbi:unnamed protein product [Rhizophagus irregularis]|nr:unnamed protein product [Rhizophagus irregularis]